MSMIHPRLTWGQLKTELERRGIRDDDVIDWIDIAGGGDLASANVWRGCEPIKANPTINPFKIEQEVTRVNSYDTEQ